MEDVYRVWSKCVVSIVFWKLYYILTSAIFTPKVNIAVQAKINGEYNQLISTEFS